MEAVLKTLNDLVAEGKVVRLAGDNFIDAERYRAEIHGPAV